MFVDLALLHEGDVVASSEAEERVVLVELGISTGLSHDPLPHIGHDRPPKVAEVSEVRRHCAVDDHRATEECARLRAPIAQPADPMSSTDKVPSAQAGIAGIGNSWTQGCITMLQEGEGLPP